MEDFKKEGFWYSKREPHLPKPIPYDKPWKNKNLFLSRLAKIQTKLRMEHYRGFSTCRICGEKVGSGEYHKNWIWPQGYLHYIEKHNVKPSKGFYIFLKSVFK